MRRVAALGAALCSSASASAQAESTVFSAAPPALQTQPTWGWVLGAAAIALVVGFMLGWRTLDRRIRKKYGGLRIY